MEMKTRRIPFFIMALALCFPISCLSPASEHVYASVYPSLYADGNTTDWGSISPISKNYTMSHTLRASNNEDDLFVLVEGGGLSSMAVQLYIDLDNNSATGSNPPGWSGTNGADVLLESEIELVNTEISPGVFRNIKHERLIRYNYDSLADDWVYVAAYEGNGQFVKGEYVIEIQIPLLDLGILPGDTIRMGFTNYGSAMDRLPQADESLVAFTLRDGTGEVIAPTAPLNLAIGHAESTKLLLTWDASTDNTGVTGYKVFRKPAAGGSETFMGWALGTEFLDRWLEPSTSYQYRVIAYDASGNASLPSAAHTGTTTAYPAVPASTGDWSKATKLLFNYTIDEAIDAAEFAEYDLLALSNAVSPEKLLEIKALNPDSFIVAYISVGQDSPIGNDIDIFFKDSNGDPECDANWPSCFIDPTHPDWQEKVLEELMPALVDRGFDGFYLDTVDVTEAIHTEKAWGMGQLIQRIKLAFPDKIVFSGGGAHLLTGDAYDIADSIDAMLFESYVSTWVGPDMWNSSGSVYLGNDERYDVYTPYDHYRKMDYMAKRDHVNRVRLEYEPDGTLTRDSNGLPVMKANADFHVYTLDYATPEQVGLMGYAAERAWADGFYPSFGMKLLYVPPAYEWMGVANYTPEQPGTVYSKENFGHGADLLRYAGITIDGDATDWAGLRTQAVYGGGTISSMKVRTDGEHLQLLVQGTDLDLPGQRIIMNTDRFITSGYQFADWAGSVQTGTDFMIENGVLFRHLGDPWSSSGWGAWLWEAVPGVLEYAVSPDGKVAEMSVPLKALTSIGQQKMYGFTAIDMAYMKFSGATTTETLPAAPAALMRADLRLSLLNVDGNGADWAALSPVASPTVGGAVNSLQAANDAYHLYMLIEGSSMNSMPGRLLLDSDNNPLTGYQSAPWSPLASTGADFMVENGQIYKYIGSGLDWSWTPIVRYPNVPVPATGYAASTAALEMAIPLDAINLSPLGTFRVAFMQYSGSSTINYYPTVVEFDLTAD